MEHTEAKQAMKELTMMLIYLSRYCEQEEFAERIIAFPGINTFTLCKFFLFTIS